MLSISRAMVRPRQPQLCMALECAARATDSLVLSKKTALPAALRAMAFHTAARRARIPQTPEAGSYAPPKRCSTAALTRGRPFSTTWTLCQRQPDAAAASHFARAAAALPDLDKVAALVNGARDRLLSHPGIPSEDDTAAALRVCAEAADLIMDAAVQPQLSHMDHQADTAAATLLSLDERQQQKQQEQTQKPAEVNAVLPSLRHVVDQISDAAFAVVDEPRVFLTPALLALYVQIQARLGRPESLPRVLDLYASKPAPKSKSQSASGAGAGTGASEILYAPQNPRRPASAVDATVAERALDAALAAKNLDAAVGVVEHTFAAPAFIRAKLLKRGFLPAFVVVGVPAATYILASQLAAAQDNMDTTTATSLAFAAILAYIAFTGTIGVVANTTANDQMRRVTWAPGTPLRERWLREEERAALDSVACAFGFREAHRYGEEEGAEFQALREYIMRKGMLLDQVELMEGMSS